MSLKYFAQSMGKIVTEGDGSEANPKGMCRRKKGKEMLHCFQKPSEDPPYFPSPTRKTEKDVWKNILKVDDENIEEYLRAETERQRRENELNRSRKKRKNDDEVAINIEVRKSIRKTEKQNAKHTTTNLVDSSCFVSNEAIKLFNPMPGEIVVDCLTRQ